MTTIPRTIAMIGLAATGCLVAAQSRDLNDTVRGSGLFTYMGRGRSLTEATVRLDSRGDFVIRFRGSDSPTFEGVWADRSDTLTLNIKTVNGRREQVSGRGTVTVGRRFDVRAIEMTGKVSDDSFSLNFTARDGGGPIGPGWGTGGSSSGDAFSGRERGRGIVEYDGRDTVREVSVLIKSNGYFDLDFSGDRRVRVSGQWDRQDNGAYELDVDRAFDRSDSRGSGSLVRNRDGSVRTIQLRGTAGSRSFRVTFDAGEGGRPDYDDSFNATIRGSGTLRVDRDSSRLNIAEIAIRDGRSFVIKVEGQKDVVFKGSWTRSGRDYVLTLTEGFSRRISGTGRVRMRDDRRAESLTLSGTADGKRFTVTVED